MLELIIPNVIEGLACATDGETTIKATQKPGIVEENHWLYGLHPSRLRMYSIFVCELVAFSLFEHFVRGGGLGLAAYLPRAAFVVGHAYAAWHNTRYI